MTYTRVLPRDLFNEAKCLKCYGRLCLLIHDNMCEAWFEHDTRPNAGFEVDQDQYDGSFFVANLRFYSKSGNLLRVSTALNSREPYPMTLATEDDEFSVFEPNGDLTDEFKEVANA